MIEKDQNGFHISHEGKILFTHSAANPSIYIGRGDSRIEAYRGNFQVDDYLTERTPLRDWEMDGDTVKIFTPDHENFLTLSFTVREGRLHFTAAFSDTSINRIWLRLPAEKEEHIYGGGEQFSYLDLRGHRFEMLTREQGVGRNKETYVTFLADQEKAGGNYDWTFFPCPVFLSSRHYFFLLEGYSYSILDFSHRDFHEITIWDSKFSVVLDCASDFKQLLYSLTEYLDRQPSLPDWALKGIWLGIQGGSHVMEQKLSVMEAAGTDITAVWCQDWQGIRYTSFGKRLMWNWMYDPELYPQLPQKIHQLHQKGIRFLGYINPYVCEGKSLYQSALQKGYLVLDQSGSPYSVDFGEFNCGIVDFTNPLAKEWYRQVIQTNLLDVGLDGWMADFGEYLPLDCVLWDGTDPMSAHNQWPVLWAQLNRQAIQEAGRSGDVVTFFRAGGTGTQRYAPLMWAGDQNVDWSLDDGLASVIVAALSSGMSGHGMHTSDAGGYTTLYHLQRSKELLLRWVEFCAFTPVLRTHEGNRPDSNWQFDSDEETIRHVARCSKLHTALFPYLKELMEENCRTGLPAMRPLFLEYPQEEACYALKYQYLLGADLLVAPVYTQGAQTVNAYLPSDQWCLIWTGEQLSKGWHTIQAPIGKPAVFFRSDSRWKQLFQDIQSQFM